MPSPCDKALDVGCGDGILTEKLASRVPEVTGIDVSAEMIALARQRVSAQHTSFIEGDFLSTPLPAEGYGFIVAVATVHHMPFDAAIIRMATLLRSRGVLAIVGLARNRSPIDYAVSAITVPVARIARARRGWWDSPAQRIDPDMAYSEIGKAAVRLLPGVEVRRRLYFRYTLVWRKP